MRIIWSRPSRNDIFAIVDYYDRNEPAIAEAILDRIEGSVEPILCYPAIGTRVTGSIRKWPVKGTPFLLFYAVRGNELEVRRVRHVRSRWREAD